MASSQANAINFDFNQLYQSQFFQFLDIDCSADGTCIGTVQYKDSIGTLHKGGIVYKTTDGFKTLEPILLIDTNDYDFDNNSHIYAAKILHDSIYFIGGSNGRVYKSINKGKTWDTLFLDSPCILEKIKFKDNGMGCLDFSGPQANCATNQKFFTSNYGKNWYKVKTDFKNPEVSQYDTITYFNSPEILENGTIFIFGETAMYVFGKTRKFILKTTDKGDTWNIKELDTLTEKPSSLDFKNNQDGFLGIQNISNKKNAIILKSTHDGGNTWQEVYQQQTPNATWFKKTVFRDEHHGFAFANFALLYTEDGGENWIDIYQKLIEKNNNLFGSIFNIRYQNDNIAYLITQEWGCVYRLDIITSVPDLINLSTFKTYPNPAKPGTAINLDFELNEDSRVSFSLADMEGKDLFSNNIGYLNQGKYLRTLNIPGNIASDIYWLKSKIGDKTYYRQIAVVE